MLLGLFAVDLIFNSIAVEYIFILFLKQDRFGIAVFPSDFKRNSNSASATLLQLSQSPEKCALSKMYRIHVGLTPPFFLHNWLYRPGLQASRLGVFRYESQALQKHVYLYGLSALIWKKTLDICCTGDRQAVERKLRYLCLKRSQEQSSVKQTDLPSAWKGDLTRRNADNMGNEVYIYFKESSKAIEEEKGEQ